LASGGQVIALVKPQFEAGRERVGKGGVVRDPDVHREVLHATLSWALKNGWRIRGLTRSPITGPKGNVEFLAWLDRGGSGPEIGDLGAAIDDVMTAGETRGAGVISGSERS